MHQLYRASRVPSSSIFFWYEDVIVEVFILHTNNDLQYAIDIEILNI